MKEIKNKYTQFQLLLEVAGILMLLSMVIFLLIRYNSIPDVIPTHFNGAGEIDKWGRKSQILIIPIVGIILYLFVTGISLYPSIWNIPCKITKKNKSHIYCCIRSMIIMLKLEMVSIFLVILYCQIEIENLPEWFMYVVLFVLLGTLAFAVIRCMILSSRYK